MVYCPCKLTENFKLFYKSNIPHFLWVDRRYNPLGMMGEHSQSSLQAFLVFSQHPARVGYNADKPIERVVYCLNRWQRSDKRTLFVKWAMLAVVLRSWRWCELRKYKFWMKMWSSQWLLQFKLLQINPKKFFETSTGFEPTASALALQCSTIWAMKIHTLGAGQFVEFILSKMIWTAEIQILNEDMIVAMKIRSSSKV